MSQMVGALRRLESLSALLGRVSVLSTIMEIHKEMAKEGLLTYDIDVRPASERGMFRGNSVEALNEWNVFFGMGDDSEFSRSMAEVMTYGDVEHYEAAVSQYKQILGDAISEMMSSIRKGFKEASAEAQALQNIEENRRNESLLRSITGAFARIVSPDERTKYPMDPDFQSKTDRQKVKEYLSSVRYPQEAIPGLLSGGFEMALLQGFANVAKDEEVVFKHISPRELIAKFESEYRDILKKAIGKASANDNKLRFQNVLPVQHASGKIYRGYEQALLRLAMEVEGMTIPVVLTSDMLSEMDLDKEGPGIPLMFCNQDGDIVNQRVWFLEQTDLEDRNPGLFAAIRGTFQEKNDKALNERVALSSDMEKKKTEISAVFGGKEGVQNIVKEILLDEYFEMAAEEIVFDVSQEEFEMMSCVDTRKIMASMDGETLPKESMFRRMVDLSSNIVRYASSLDLRIKKGIDLSSIKPVAVQKDRIVDMPESIEKEEEDDEGVYVDPEQENEMEF